MSTPTAFIKANHTKFLEELKAYLSIPSISSEPDYKGEVQRCAEWTAEHLAKAGLNNAAVHPTNGHPVVYADWLGAPGKPTLLIYGHYDVQPVDPIELWERPPFEPHVKDNAIVARGSADDKGQLFMHVKAVEAWMHTAGKLPVNVKFIIEGEEEIASPNLPKFLKDNKSLLAADVVLISDTEMWTPDTPSITYGLRGLTYLEIELTGPNRDLHSGQYGGAVANPAEILCRLLAQVKDANGRIQIPGFYDDVIEPSAEERAILEKVPFTVAEYKAGLGVSELWGESPYSVLEQSWLRPTFEINGIWSGFTGRGAKTVLPAVANAKISTRLVPNQEPDKIADLVEKFFQDRAPKSVKVKVVRHSGGHPVVTSLDNPFMNASKRALRETFGSDPLFIRTGGSIPIVADFKKILGLDSILIGFALPGCRAHSPNENFYLPPFYTGIESIAKLFELIGE